MTTAQGQCIALNCSCNNCQHSLQRQLEPTAQPTDSKRNVPAAASGARAARLASRRRTIAAAASAFRLSSASLSALCTASHKKSVICAVV